MKEKRVLRWYCDYCKKSGCNKSIIAKHEKGCTLNPNRDCRMCILVGERQVPLIELIKIVPDIDKLREVTGNCPNCVLAAIRQSKIDPTEEMYKAFNYKDEVQGFWADYNGVQKENQENAMNFYPYYE